MQNRWRIGLLSTLTAVLACCVGVLAVRAQVCCVGAEIAPFREDAASTDTIVVTDVSPYWTPTGSVVVVGFVTNLSAESVTDVQVTASLIDRARENVATTRATLVPRVLPPGTRAPWRVEIPGAPWQQGARARGSALPLDPEDAATALASPHIDAVSVQENMTGYMSRLGLPLKS